MSNVTSVNTTQLSMETEAVKTVILENLTSLRRFAYSLTNNVSDADDLVQIVVEKLLKKPIPDTIKPLPWIFRVCKNTWIDEIRSREVRKPDENVEVEHITSSGSDNEIEQELQKRDLKAAMSALPNSHREVISLIIVSGFSYAETADSLDIPIGTVMSRVARAREKLASKLREESR